MKRMIYWEDGEGSLTPREESGTVMWPEWKLKIMIAVAIHLILMVLLSWS